MHFLPHKHKFAFVLIGYFFCVCFWSKVGYSSYFGRLHVRRSLPLSFIQFWNVTPSSSNLNTFPITFLRVSVNRNSTVTVTILLVLPSSLSNLQLFVRRSHSNKSRFTFCQSPPYIQSAMPQNFPLYEYVLNCFLYTPSWLWCASLPVFKLITPVERKF
jgi:hypothetical protein